MKSLCLTLTAIVLLAFCGPLGIALADDAPKQEGVVLQIEAYELRPADKKPRLVAGPSVMTLLDRPIKMVAGGKQNSKFDQSEHEIGLKLNANITRHGEESYELKLDLTQANVKRTEEDSDMEIFFEEKIHARTILKAGQAKKISISPLRWYELTITPFDDLPAPGPEVQANPSTASSAAKERR